MVKVKAIDLKLWVCYHQKCKKFNVYICIYIYIYNRKINSEKKIISRFITFSTVIITIERLNVICINFRINGVSRFVIIV